MKILLVTACLLLLLSNTTQWQNLAPQVAEFARQQFPQLIAKLWPQEPNACQPAKTPGLEKQIAARLRETLQELSESEGLQQARVVLKQVRFISANGGADVAESVTNQIRHSEGAEELPTTGYYVATINYDLLSPLTVESGATLLTAACSCGVAKVRLSDGFGVVKTFRCPALSN